MQNIIYHLIKPCILIAIFISLTFQTLAQNEMETSCLKRIKQSSVNHIFPKFNGRTSISKDTIKFDYSLIVIRDAHPEIVNIFIRGIIFPDLIFASTMQGDKYKIKGTPSADTLLISNVSELHFTNQSLYSRSFSFLLWEKNIANPSLYMFELTNINSNSKATIRTFVEKSKVTAFGFCSILI